MEYTTESGWDVKVWKDGQLPPHLYESVVAKHLGLVDMDQIFGWQKPMRMRQAKKIWQHQHRYSKQEVLRAKAQFYRRRNRVMRRWWKQLTEEQKLRSLGAWWVGSWFKSIVTVGVEE